MGVVYLAEDARLDRLVVLKTLKTAFTDAKGSPEQLRRFYQEAKAAAKLNHPNIVTIHGIEEADGVPFIAMEFIEGSSLQEIIKERRELLTLKKLQIIIDLCKGLNYAHQHGVVHRDIKPGNIMLANNGQVKIVDFGIARVDFSSMTRTGDVMGTYAYMSPEQVRSQKVDARSDVFSVGVVLYELFTYHLPFPGHDVPSITFKIVHEPPEPIARYLHPCPPQLEQTIQMALAKDREKRYQTCLDLAFDLQRFGDTLRRSTVGAYLDQGQRSLQAGDLTLAEESLQKVLEIDSSHELAQSLLAKIRERIQSRQRKQTIDRSLQEAKDALAAEQFEEAYGLVEEALHLDPGNKEAQLCRRLVIQQRERAAKVRSHLERAERLAADAAFQQAKEELESVLTIDPGNTAAFAMMDSVVRELTEQERHRCARQYLDSARLYLTEKNFARALELLDQACKLNVFTVEIETLSRLARSGQEREERRQLLVKHLAEIEEHLKRGQFDEAFEQVEHALREFPEDPQVLRLQAQALRRAEAYKKNVYVEAQILAARELLEKSLYASALAILEQASNAVPNDPRLTSLLMTVHEADEQSVLEASKKIALREANEHLRTQNFDAAIRTLEEILARIGQSAELSELLQFARERNHDKRRQEAVHLALSQAQGYLREEQYEEAVQILERAQEEWKADEIAELLTTAETRRAAFVLRREEIVASALQMLQAGQAAEAIALFETAPKIYFKNESFQRTYSQCRQSLGRSNLVPTATEQIKERLADEDINSEESVLELALKPNPNKSAQPAQYSLVNELDLRLRREQRVKLLEEIQVALAHKQYTRANELLNSVEWESGELDQAHIALGHKEYPRASRRLHTVKWEKPSEFVSPLRAGKPSIRAKAPKRSRVAVRFTIVAALLVLASIGTMWHVKGRNVAGYLQLTAAPWGQVTDVTGANGKHLGITGEMPLQVQLPAGDYSVGLKQGFSKLSGIIEVRVERDKVSFYNYTFPETKIHDLIETLLSESTATKPVPSPQPTGHLVWDSKRNQLVRATGPNPLLEQQVVAAAQNDITKGQYGAALEKLAPAAILNPTSRQIQSMLSKARAQELADDQPFQEGLEAYFVGRYTEAEQDLSAYADHRQGRKAGLAWFFLGATHASRYFLSAEKDMQQKQLAIADFRKSKDTSEFPPPTDYFSPKICFIYAQAIGAPPGR